MASTDNNNMSTMLGLGFKGAGKPNGVPAYNQTGVYCLGGVQNSADTQTMKYGVVVNSDPTQDDGIFSVGAVVTPGVASVFDWTITAACSADGNINIDGVVLAVTTTGQGTVNNVATAIRAMTLPRWTLTGSGAHVIFTAKAATVYAAPTYNFYSTGITRTTSTTTAGTVGTVPRGIVVYRPDIAMIDLSKPDYILQGTPLAVAYFGPIWIGSYGKTAANAIDPIIGAVVIAKNDTGVIEFQPAGTSSAPSGWYILANTTVKSVSLDTNGALLMVSI